MTRLLLVAAALVAVLAAGVVSGAGAEWDVYPGGSIQDAIDGTGAGDTIFVHAGTYVENVDVDKERLTLIGDGADVVMVRAVSTRYHVFRVTVDHVNISGFTATGATGYDAAGMYLGHAEHCNITSNNCSNNWGGIYLRDLSNNTLTHNTASNNDNGILLSSSSNNTLQNNTASNNDYRGIWLGGSSNNTLHHNNLIDNTNYNAYDTSTNQWDSGTEGNYWSDYREKYPDAEEIDESGIWNTPYAIPGGAGVQDRYPLLQPWTATSQKGDLNSDGNITPTDAAIALRLAAIGAHKPRGGREWRQTCHLA